MVFKRLVLTLLVFGIGLNVFAQRFKEFSGNSDTYIEELIEFYKSDVNMKKDKQKEYEELILKYSSIWSAIPSQQKQDVIVLSNDMLKKRVRPIPALLLQLQITQTIR